MLRRIMYVLGLSVWCKEEGIVRHCNEGLKKPSREFVPMTETIEIQNGVFATSL